MRRPVAVVVKGYPRLSETFIAQEILALERRGIEIVIVLAAASDGPVHPPDSRRDSFSRALPAGVSPRGSGPRAPRVGDGAAASRSCPRPLAVAGRPGARPAPGIACAASARRSCSRRSSAGSNRSMRTSCTLRRPSPATQARCSASDGASPPTPRDVWTTPDWEKREKLADARFGVTCTRGQPRSPDGACPPRPTRSSWCTTGWIGGRFSGTRGGTSLPATAPILRIR